MLSIKAHFDGHNVVLDEPAVLAVGQAVFVVVETLQTDKNIDDMTDDELAEWLEVETHRLRGVPYNHSHAGLDISGACSTDFWDNQFDDEDWNSQ